MSEAVSTPATTPEAAGASAPEGAGAETVIPPGADTGSPPTAQVQPPAPAPSDQAKETAQRFEQAKQYELRLRSQRRQFDAEVRQHQEQVRTLSAREQKLREAEEDHALLLEDPLAWAEKRKVDPEILADRILRPMTPESRKLKEIEDKMAAKEKAEADAKERAERERGEHDKWENRRQLVQTLNPDDHPSVTSVYEPWEIPSVVEHELAAPCVVDMGDGTTTHSTVLQHFVDVNGRYPSLQEVADFLEQRTKARIGRVKSPGTASQASATANGQSEQASPGQTTPASQNGRPTTLTNNPAAEASSGRTNGKTRDQLRDELLRQMQAEDSANDR